MKLTFLGTRGNIKARTQRHRMHTSLLASYYGKNIMIDCGEDWLGNFQNLNLHAIVITHAHPDHAFGLQDGAPCPVYATAESWEDMQNYPIQKRYNIVPRQKIKIAGISFEAFPVDHSTNSPAVGYRISAGRRSFFYVPDVVYILNRSDALSGIDLYIGDGATLIESMVRKPDDELIGHTPVRTQLTWCQKEGVPKMLITHCGSEIVKGDERKLGAELRRLAEDRGVEVEIAYDSKEVILR